MQNTVTDVRLCERQYVQ